ncbi:superoxide dismutase family protein [Paenibacillus sp. CGMCC 1.16610]|uniref:Superoxide dismutase [Cu-Zn] n=1 Tax=Paenibacillus anseongense TaxID=2682845 RepID=A0ABW9UCW7_9BACL|nr:MULTISPECIES: superoxide dismutase family protein [Paenibacillus]MBA2938015.1 superoxide dismutase family protein [Paenibacillus sp. CGMCC 1.16610]MVQ37073.1 superoxide dismutase [Paenibacillus anseongense]
MKSLKIVVTVSLGLLVLTGCQSVKSTATAEAGSTPPLEVTLIGASGQTVGMAQLAAAPEGVQIDLQVSGLTPGAHGFHIHEKAACDAPTFDSAGAHFNPMHKEHGFLNPKGAHAGDLPNLVVDEQGNGRLSTVTKSVVLLPDKPNSLFKPGGTSLVIHEKADDLKTDPSGNSGKRIACGAVK